MGRKEDIGMFIGINRIMIEGILREDVFELGGDRWMRFLIVFLKWWFEEDFKRLRFDSRWIYFK